MEAYEDQNTRAYRQQLADYHRQQRQVIEQLRISGLSSTTVVAAKEIMENPLVDAITALPPRRQERKSSDDLVVTSRRVSDESFYATPTATPDTNLSYKSARNSVVAPFSTLESPTTALPALEVKTRHSTPKRTKSRLSPTKGIFRLFRRRTSEESV